MSASQLKHQFNVLVRRKPDTRAIGNGERTALLYDIPDSGHYSDLRDSDSPSSPSNRPFNFISILRPRHVFRTAWVVLKNSYINLLLVFVPIGLVAGVSDWPPILVFILNFLAVVPLASLLSFATEEMSEAVGPSVGGLLNATFGNAIELIVSIIALNKGQYRLVQASILGSVLVNILLVLGCCFIGGGIRRTESKYDPTVAAIMSALLTLSASSLIVPTILYRTIEESDAGDSGIDIIQVSRGTAIILIVLYGFYLYFQLGSHSQLFQDDVGDDDNDDESQQGIPDSEAQKESQKSGDILGPMGALSVLVATTICVGFCAEFLVDSIESVVEQTGMTTTFIGLILLPIISNAAEHVTAVIVSWKGKMNLALLVDLGSGMQVALFVTPLLVLVAWAMDQPFSLHFQLFETIVFFLSVLVVNFLIRGGTSNYLEGVMCVGWYLIIALAFFYYPDS